MGPGISAKLLNSCMTWSLVCCIVGPIGIGEAVDYHTFNKQNPIHLTGVPFLLGASCRTLLILPTFTCCSVASATCLLHPLAPLVTSSPPAPLAPLRRPPSSHPVAPAISGQVCTAGVWPGLYSRRVQTTDCSTVLTKLMEYGFFFISLITIIEYIYAAS